MTLLEEMKMASCV